MGGPSRWVGGGSGRATNLPPNSNFSSDFVHFNLKIRQNESEKLIFFVKNFPFWGAQMVPRAFGEGDGPVPPWIRLRSVLST